MKIQSSIKPYAPTKKDQKRNCRIHNNHTGVSTSGTGGAYSGSPGSAKLLTNCAIPVGQMRINLRIIQDN